VIGLGLAAEYLVAWPARQASGVGRCLGEKGRRGY